MDPDAMKNDHIWVSMVCHVAHSLVHSGDDVFINPFKVRLNASVLVGELRKNVGPSKLFLRSEEQEQSVDFPLHQRFKQSELLERGHLHPHQTLLTMDHLRVGHFM